MTGAIAFIGLGSNLENPAEQLRKALQALHQLPTTQLLLSSSLYSSAPIGPQDQPTFINAVAQLHTQLAPIALLNALQAIENTAGRVRTRHWGERTLDLDILLYGDQHISLPRLQVPHPHMRHRRFVLQPLLEIAPTIHLPNSMPLQQSLAATHEQEIWPHSKVDLAALLSI